MGRTDEERWGEQRTDNNTGAHERRAVTLSRL